MLRVGVPESGSCSRTGRAAEEASDVADHTFDLNGKNVNRAYVVASEISLDLALQDLDAFWPECRRCLELCSYAVSINALIPQHCEHRRPLASHEEPVRHANDFESVILEVVHFVVASIPDCHFV